MSAGQHASRRPGPHSQIRQLETAVGIALLRTGPDGELTLTAYGQRFARDVRPALESLAQSRSQTTRHAP
jgi:DNA-binding transcriptional LysR family regulator